MTEIHSVTAAGFLRGTSV